MTHESERLLTPYERCHHLCCAKRLYFRLDTGVVLMFLKQLSLYSCTVTECHDLKIDCIIVKGEKTSRQGENTSPGSMICVLPNQGILQPFEKIPVFFRFSPRSVALCTVVVNCTCFFVSLAKWIY